MLPQYLRPYLLMILTILSINSLPGFLTTTQAQTSETTLERNKKEPVRRVKKAPIKNPSLTIELRVYKRVDNDTKQAVNPLTVFHTGDNIQISLTPNQSGYLYIIHHLESKDGELVFPDSRIDNGRNYIEKGREYLIPRVCASSSANECYWTLTPSPANKEQFTIIFTPKIANDLTVRLTENGGLIKQVLIDEIKNKIPVPQRDKNLRSPDHFENNDNFQLWVANSGQSRELVQTFTIINQSTASH